MKYLCHYTSLVSSAHHEYFTVDSTDCLYSLTFSSQLRLSNSIPPSPLPLSPPLALILPLPVNLNLCASILSVPVLQKEAKAIKFDVTRTDFEQGCSVLFDRALAPVSRLLRELGKTAHLFSSFFSLSLFSTVLLESSTGSLNFALFYFN